MGIVVTYIIGVSSHNKNCWHWWSVGAAITHSIGVSGGSNYPPALMLVGVIVVLFSVVLHSLQTLGVLSSVGLSHRIRDTLPLLTIDARQSHVMTSTGHPVIETNPGSLQEKENLHYSSPSNHPPLIYVPNSI